MVLQSQFRSTQAKRASRHHLASTSGGETASLSSEPRCCCCAARSGAASPSLGRLPPQQHGRGRTGLRAHLLPHVQRRLRPPVQATPSQPHQ